MRRWLAIFVGTILAGILPIKSAFAGVPCSVPFTLTNGSPADATQVMANYTAILNCLANGAAASGVNSDITALVGLLTPLGPASGGSSVFIGSGATGINTIVVATTLPTGFVLSTGFEVTFTSTGSNTASTTLQVGAQPQRNFYRQTPGGPAPMVGGEIVTGQQVVARYDGTQWQMTSTPALNYPPGAVFDFASPSCPVGSLEATGSNIVSQTTFPTLFGVVGTTWGAATGGNFTIPDLRGRTTYSRDISSSNRITAAGGNFDGTTVGNTGGQQNKVVGQANLANFNFATASGTVTGGTTGATGSTSITWGGGSGPNSFLNGPGAGIAVSTTVTSGGGNIPLPTLSNAAIVVKCIKA
jgi:microcystin-dependent protein